MKHGWVAILGCLLIFGLSGLLYPPGMSEVSAEAAKLVIIDVNAPEKVVAGTRFNVQVIVEWNNITRLVSEKLLLRPRPPYGFYVRICEYGKEYCTKTVGEEWVMRAESSGREQYNIKVKAPEKAQSWHLTILVEVSAFSDLMAEFGIGGIIISTETDRREIVVEVGLPDKDNDGLDDDDEIKIGTSVDDTDTDDDGLTDFQEVKVTSTDPLKADSDGDALRDSEEVNDYKTDPLKTDTDEDELTDNEEIKEYKTDPLQKDTDGDTLEDKSEIERGTDPVNPDTDGDELNDSEEVSTYETDPTKKDTDDDGLGDRDEISTYHTNPLTRDGDGDGISDGDEIKRNTDPSKSDTDGDYWPDSSDMNPLSRYIPNTFVGALALFVALFIVQTTMKKKRKQINVKEENHVDDGAG